MGHRSSGFHSLFQWGICGNSAKSRRLAKLVAKSYDLSAEGTDSEAVFLERAIEQEEDENLKKALQDLDEFLFGW